MGSLAHSGGSTATDDRVNRRVSLLLLAIALVQGLLYSTVVPLWQAPDEAGHFEAVRLLSDEGRVRARGERSLPLQREIIGSLTRADFWRFTGQTPPESLPIAFADDPFLQKAGSQIGRQPITYYVIPALLVRLLSDLDAQVRLARWYSVVLSALAVWVAARTGHMLFAGEPLLAVGIPILLALGPMPAFMGSVINNDSLANLSSGLVWWAAAVILLRGWHIRRGVALLLALALALASKRTTLFLLPVMLFLPPLYVWSRGWQRSGYFWKACWGFVAGLIGLALMFALWHPAQVAGWRLRPLGGMAVQSNESARSGRSVLLLRDDSAAGQLRTEQVVRAGLLRGETVTLAAWVRGTADGTVACLVLDDEEGPATETCVSAVATWQRIQVRRRIDEEATLLYASVSVGSQKRVEAQGTLTVDDVRLSGETGQGNLLGNGGMEQRASALAIGFDRLSKVLPMPPDAWVRLWNPASYDASSLARYVLYLALTFAGFWGNFGWLQLPLPLIWYEVLALICLISVAGWVRMVMKRSVWKSLGNRPQRAVMILFGIGTALALVQTFLPMIGRAWQPQGRYLFPALVPIAAWLLVGLGAWTSERGRRTLLVVWVAGLFLLNAVALVETIVPAYHLPLPGQKVF